MAGLDLFTLHMKKLIPVFALVLLSVGFTASAFAQDATATNTPPAFNPHWSFNGQFFADYYNMLSGDSVSGKGYDGPTGKSYYEPNNHTPNGATDNQKYYQAFDMRRVQFGANYYYSKDITAKVLMEHESAYAGGDVLGDNKSGFYVKEASLTFGNWIPMANVIFGQQGMNMFSVDEGLWGFRGVEKSILDMRGASETGSNDLGIQVQGNFDKDQTFGYSVSIVNYDNSSKVEDLKNKVIAGQLTGKFLDKHLVLDITGDYVGLGTAASISDSDYANGKTTATNVDQSASLIKGALAYDSKPITIGVVYAMHTLAGQSKSVAGNNAQQTGLSIFAHGQIIEKSLNAFARYDMWDPDKNANDNLAGRKENFITAGLDWIPESVANVHVDPNIEINSFSDKDHLGRDYASITALRLTFWAKF